MLKAQSVYLLGLRSAFKTKFVDAVFQQFSLPAEMNTVNECQL